MKHGSSGFSLIEILVVMLIVGILLLAALPSNEGKVDRALITESLMLVEPYKLQVAAFYHHQGEFPADNAMAGMPAPERIVGNYLVSVELDNGALHMELGNKVRPELHGQVVSVRPIFVPDEFNAPVSWICGHDTVPDNMLAAGDNRTDVESFRLPLACR